MCTILIFPAIWKRAPGWGRLTSIDSKEETPATDNSFHLHVGCLSSFFYFSLSLSQFTVHSTYPKYNSFSLLEEKHLRLIIFALSLAAV